MDEAARKKLYSALVLASDDGKVDTGAGMGNWDFWVKLGGVEYFLNARAREVQPRTPQTVAPVVQMPMRAQW